MLRVLLLAVLCASAAAAQTRPVTFEVVVPGVLAPLDTVYLAGTVNGWNPGNQPEAGAALPMVPAGPNRFRLTLDVAGDSVAYKYTLGSWRSVEMTAADGERDNRLLGDRRTARDTVEAWLVPSVARGAWRVEDLLFEQGASVRAWVERSGDALFDSLSTAEVDARLAEAEAAWAADAARLGFPALPLQPFALLPFRAGRGDGREAHLFQTVFLPRMTALVDAFESEPPHVSRLFVLSDLVSLAVADPRSFRMDAATATAAEALAARVVALAERYCAADAGFGPRGGVACRLRDTARASNVLWPLVAASARGDAAAIDGLIARLDAGIETQADAPLVAGLAIRHATRTGGDGGLRLLDALLTRTTDRFTAPDSLRAAYVRMDPEGGLARFDRLLPERPAFRLAALDGAPRLDGLVMPDVVARAAFSFDDLAGRLVLLDVWATWCGPCLAEIPTFNAFHDSLAGRTDIAFVSILADARTGGMLPQDAEAFVAERGVRYPALYDLGDDGLGAALDVTAYPSKYLVYPDGTLRPIPMDVSWRTAVRLATDELGLVPVAAD